jgi:hypothetical protein
MTSNWILFDINVSPKKPKRRYNKQITILISYCIRVEIYENFICIASFSVSITYSVNIKLSNNNANQSTNQYVKQR